ncbi:MAG: hypothetical protein ACE5GT_10835 [Rhodospirillales bacterium]
MPEPRDVHVDATLSSLSVQYRNEAFIWREVMPPINVLKRSDKYFKYDKDQRFRVPDDALGPKSVANEIELKVSTDNYSVVDHGLEDWVSVEEEENADTPLSPRVDATEFLADQLELAQAKRVAAVVFLAATYPAGNKVQLSGTSQWGGSTDDPIGDIMTGLDTVFSREDAILVFGADAWRKYRQLPEVLDAVKPSTRFQATPGGLASREDVASLFEVRAVLVGRSRENTAKEGQTAVFVRLWGKHAAILSVRPNPGVRTVVFGGTFMESDKVTMTGFDGRRGVKGATWLKTGWNSDEKIIASDLGYFIENAVA